MEQYAIIPNPKLITYDAGLLQLNGNSTISYHPAGKEAGHLIARITRLKISAETGTIRFEIDSQIRGAEAYHIDITSVGIRVAASTGVGLFYGAQTLRQLLPADTEQSGINRTVDLRCGHIEDEPRFAHRGFMLDVSRHFFGPEEIKRILDLLALQKINRFHWHLSDDQGWRIEIKKYPRLTEIGSKRRQTQVGGWLLSKSVYDGQPYEGFYTQAEVREIVAYAKANFIEVIPEIDAPGHSSAAIAAYPELSCSGEQIEVRSSVTTFSNPMCVGKELPFEILDDVFTELAELFPYKHIHIGTDEVQKKAWKKCPHCQRRMKQEGLKDLHALQTYFANRLVKIVQSKGCKAIGWNEVLDDSLDPEVINQFWFSFSKKKTIAALKKGRRTIVSEFTSFYLDYAYRVFPLIKTYQYEPHYKELNESQCQAILGVEGALWAEYVDSRARIDWQMFPRLLAISEIGWSQKGRKNYQDFLARLEGFEKRLDVLGVSHASRDCYLQPQSRSLIPPMLKVLFTKEHPGTSEFKKYAIKGG